MAKKCKKCDPHEICEECPEWIFTLADLIMCMMGLFVIMWVLKPSPTPQNPQSAADVQQAEEDWLIQVGEIRAAFGYVPDPTSPDKVDLAMEKRRMRLVGPGQQGTQNEKQEAAEGTDPTVTNIRPSKMSAVGTRVEFDPGDAALSQADTRILQDIATKVRGTRFIVIVKGHTSRDDFGEGATPQQFMDLSIKRAQAAADYLVSRGVSPDILRVQGCSIFEPIQQRVYTREGQQVNRRVEVFSTDLIVRDLQDTNRVSTLPRD